MDQVTLSAALEASLAAMSAALEASLAATSAALDLSAKSESVITATTPQTAIHPSSNIAHLS